VGTDLIGELLMNQIRRTETVLRSHSDLLGHARSVVPHYWPAQPLAELAADWSHFGFDADNVRAWLNARCFSPMAARDLHRRGISPNGASQTTSAGVGVPETVGFKVSAACLLPEDATTVLDRRPPSPPADPTDHRLV
jgi:hypothetical protein